jgi:hypothetical protein
LSNEPVRKQQTLRKNNFNISRSNISCPQNDIGRNSPNQEGLPTTGRNRRQESNMIIVGKKHRPLTFMVTIWKDRKEILVNKYKSVSGCKIYSISSSYILKTYPMPPNVIYKSVSSHNVLCRVDVM